MIVRILAVAAAGLAAMLNADAHAQQLPDASFPESLARAADGSLYAGSVVEGAIVRVAPGADHAQPFVSPGSDGLMSVEGLYVDDAAQLLYACSADLGVAQTPKTDSALVAFDLATGAPRGRWPLPRGGFCNDIAPDAAGRLFISDTQRPRVLLFDPRDRSLTTWTEHSLLGGAAFNGNGIVVDGDAVYVSTFSDGRLLRILIKADGSAGTPLALSLPRPLAGADALRRLATGQLLVFENDIAGGNGRVTRIDIDRDFARLTPLAEGLAEPTSGVLANGQVIVLESQFRKLFGSDKGHPPNPFKLRTVPLVKEPASVSLPQSFAYPNGIAVEPDGSLYVGSVTDGTILRRRGRKWERWRKGDAVIFAATSLRIDQVRRRMWVASPDFATGGRSPRPHRIAVIDLNTRRLIHHRTLPDDGFGNDIAVAADGGVFVTDSRNGRILYLPSPSSPWEIVLADEQLKGPGGLGVAGIAVDRQGRMVVGNFGTGRLFAVEARELREVKLPRLLSNPDGLAFDAAGDLLVVEGDVAGGNGCIQRVHQPFGTEPRTLQLIGDQMESPVNLSIGKNGAIWVTEARIRHRMLPDLQLPQPASFRVVEILNTTQNRMR